MTAEDAASSSPGRSALGRLRVPKASDLLADELRERILSGELPPGAVLPGERILVAQTRLSRTTVHEALRLLELQGLLELRAGRGGGAYVARPGEETVADSLKLLVRGRHIGLHTLLETRASIEPACASLAARHRVTSDLQTLEAANHALSAGGELSGFLNANVDWHVAVAMASHNELLAGLMMGLARLIYTATDDAGFVDDRVRAATVHAHRRITDAIRDRDPFLAERRMRRHVHAYVEGALAEEPPALNWSNGGSDHGS